MMSTVSSRHHSAFIILILVSIAASGQQAVQTADETGPQNDDGQLLAQANNNNSSKKPIEVHISTPDGRFNFELGSSFTLHCRFKRSGGGGGGGQSAQAANLRFNLRWLRSVAAFEGQNQTITETDIDSSTTIIAATTRIWSVRKDDGLDLELNHFQANDAGLYYCQAVSAADPSSSSSSSSSSILEHVLHETSVQISAIQTPAPTRSQQQQQLHPIDEPQQQQQQRFKSSSSLVDGGLEPFDSYQLYSQENLSKLLPSLKIIPQFANHLIPIGERIQLACVTNNLDPDPEPDKIEWTFEHFGDSMDLLDRAPTLTSQMPYNITILGNILIIWSMLEEHSGIYRCTYQMADFNLTAQASVELMSMGRWNNGVGSQHQQQHQQHGYVDSAPLVFVKPELIRLSVNGSASIQCEATGYPPPELIWYRVNDFAKSELLINTSTTDAAEQSVNPSNDYKIAQSHIDGLIVERIDFKDLGSFCRLDRCMAQPLGGGGGGGGATGRQSPKLTGASIIHLDDAKARHQGQYVCQASNKHGSNQASCLVDVEIKEMPAVEIPAQFVEQTIVLDDGGAEQNVTFRCRLLAGRPRARLRWLRTGNNGLKTDLQADNLDLYDLTKVSSATSNVRTISDDNGHSLALMIGTISLDDEGNYVCLAENEVGRHSAVARLIVRRPASIRILQPSPHLANVNASFHLDCLVTGHPIPIDIEWSRTDRGSFFSLLSPAAARGSQSGAPASQERAILKFDRVTQEDSGEYTCNARDPLNPATILRDTIMVVVGESAGRHGSDGAGGGASLARANEQASLLPKLMVRPTKVNALLGSNVTLDCLAVSGLQPTLVEWSAPTTMQQSISATDQQHRAATTSGIRSYYRASDESAAAPAGQLLQFGSKLRILNVSRVHEGIYQCKGRNKVGTEIAPALIKVLDPNSGGSGGGGQAAGEQQWGQVQPATSSLQPMAERGQTKTKIARHGSNIELKCQVNGIEQPATSWSRDKLELPKSSVQIGHNLWIQNVTSRDGGLYVCSARSREPNRVIQARINLMVEGSNESKRLKNLEAKIVASKSQVNKGDSITLECIISGGGGSSIATAGKKTSDAGAGLQAAAPEKRISADELEEIERNVVWTNLHSGQSLFQDNVYILGNLLIIYELKYENSATYRCNYNDLAQYTDYSLRVLPSAQESGSADNSSSYSSISPDVNNDNSNNNNNNSGQWPLHARLFNQIITSSRGHKAELKQVSVGSRLSLDCNNSSREEDFFWARGSWGQRIAGSENRPLVFDSIRPRDADIYACYSRSSNNLNNRYLVNVLLPVARFTQSPVSFITLPTVSGANQQLEIELKFLPENEHGLLLFNGQQQQLLMMAGQRNGSSSTGGGAGDYLALGLQSGFLEFKFELGDGTTTLRSLQPVSMNHWHRVLIERNRRGALMWLDDQPVVSNSSTGKFFNLNLDSVLFVGGHQQFLYRSSEISRGGAGQQAKSYASLYGYSSGFQGCISLLRIARQEVNLMARNRSVAVGIFECDKAECGGSSCVAHAADMADGSVAKLDSVCQVDRSDFEQIWEPANGQASSRAGLRCICMPGLEGDRCERSANTSTINYQHRAPLASASSQPAASPQAAKQGACELLNPCSPQGTAQCQSLTSQSFSCHCRMGFTGSDCSRAILFDRETTTSVQFNQNAYLRLKFNKPQAVEAQLRAASNQSPSGSNHAGTLFLGDNEFSAADHAKRISMSDHQNISFNLQTKSSYGLLFYTGQLVFNHHHHSSSPSSDNHQHHETNTTMATVRLKSSPVQQTSKSMIVNLMSRLSPPNSVSDYLAIALIDGHVEVSFELGSGVSIMRSSQRVNDDQVHSINVSRTGKLAKLTIDRANKYEASSPGKLSMLNSDQEHFYIGGLPLGLDAGRLDGHSSQSSSSSSTSSTSSSSSSVIYSTYFANFVGCISQLEINSLGPLNLIHSDHLTELQFAQNLLPCSAASKQQQQPVDHGKGNNSGASNKTTKPQRPYTSPPVESDDPDELK